ncbi:MAG: hypothetical protein ACFFCW_40645 [Candidatus Hodarchaeota archaeon]
MSEKKQLYLVQIECYDALGYYEENAQRILLVMESLGHAKTIKRDWVRGQAVGGSWARALRFTFETKADPIQIKKWMVGLEYSPINALPRSLQHLVEKKGLFRFADIDVIELVGGVDPGAIRRFVSRLGIGKRKVEKADLSHDARSPEFISECRNDLVNLLDPPLREKLFSVENAIFDQLKEKPPMSNR